MQSYRENKRKELEAAAEIAVREEQRHQESELLTGLAARSYHKPVTLDERIDKLTDNQAKTQIMLADIVDGIKRLERIALAHEVRLQDVEGTLSMLEARRPQ